MPRKLSWDDTAMKVVEAYEKRSHCIHFKVAAVFFRDDRLLAVGYNGSSKGEPHCDEVGCAKMGKDGKRLPAASGLCRGAHAEMNAIANAAAEGIMLKGSRLYCSYSPCYSCAKVLANIPITEFIYKEQYPDEDNRAIELFLRRGVAVRQYGKSKKKIV